MFGGWDNLEVSLCGSQLAGFQELDPYELWRLLALEDVGQGVPALTESHRVCAWGQSRSLWRTAGVGKGL